MIYMINVTSFGSNLIIEVLYNDQMEMKYKKMFIF